MVNGKMTEKTKQNTYQCELCKGVFEKGRTDEEALEESRDIWGEISQKDRVLICEDCHNKIVKKMN